MPDIDDIWDDEEDYLRVQEFARRAFYLEGSRPVYKLPPVGQQMVDAWRAEHGDEEFPE